MSQDEIKVVHGIKIPSKEDIEELRDMLDEATAVHKGANIKIEDLDQVDLDSALKLIDTLSILLMDNIEKLHKLGYSIEEE
jgi:hypothetical protein